MDEEAREISFRVFRWKPCWGDLAPFGLWLFLSGLLQIARIAGPRAALILEWLSPLSDLGFFVVPVLFVRLLDKKGLNTLGVTKRHIVAAVILGVIIGAITGFLNVLRPLLLLEIPFLPGPLESVAYFCSALYHLIATEFFYRGWLAARLDRSYGFLPAVLGSGLLYAISPLVLWGTSPSMPAAYTSLGFYWSVVFPFTLFMGILLAGITRLTCNLAAPILSMIPQTIVRDLLPGGAAHQIRNPESMLVGTFALAGISVVVVWLTRTKRHEGKTP